MSGLKALLRRAGKDQGKIVVADLLSVDLYALIDPYQVGRGIEANAPPLRAQLIGDEGARRPLAVRAADMDCREMPLRTAEDVEQSLGGAEAPFDATGLSTEKELAGFFEDQSAASAGQAPVMCRNNCAAVSRNSPRGTTASIIP